MIRSIADLNERAREFWDLRNAELERRMSDSTVAQLAADRVKSDVDRHVPFHSRISFYEAAEEAERHKAIFKRSYALEIASKERPDRLQEFIMAALERDPHLTAPKLHELLRKAQYTGSIRLVTDGIVEFNDRDGREKQAAAAGLKDRLSRARKKRLRASR